MAENCPTCGAISSERVNFPTPARIKSDEVTLGCTGYRCPNRYCVTGEFIDRESLAPRLVFQDAVVKLRYRNEREKIISRCRCVKVIRRVRELIGPPGFRHVLRNAGPLFAWAMDNRFRHDE